MKMFFFCNVFVPFFLSSPYVGRSSHIYLFLDTCLKPVKAEKRTTVPSSSWSLSVPTHDSSPIETLQESVC